MSFERITIDPAQMGGQPCIRGLRMPVATVVAMVADGMTAPGFDASAPTELAAGRAWSKALGASL